MWGKQLLPCTVQLCQVETWRQNWLSGPVAQRIRHLTTNQGIAGSSPARVNIFTHHTRQDTPSTVLKALSTNQQNYTNTLSRKPSLIWTYVQLEKTTLSPEPVENQSHNNGIQFPLLEGDTFHNKIEKELCAPGWARTTNLSVNSRTR